jgi:hypothetical protein
LCACICPFGELDGDDVWELSLSRREGRIASSFGTDFLGPFVAKSNFSGSPAKSVELGDEVSQPRCIKPAHGGALEDLFGDMTFGSFTGSDLDSNSESCNNFDSINGNKSTSSREVFADLYDGVTDPESDENFMIATHQICVITGENREADEGSESFEELGNPYIDPADLTRGTGAKYVGTEPREKLSLPQGAWDRATRAMDCTEPMTMQVSPAALQAYHYKITRSRRELEKLRRTLAARKAAADASSERRNNLSRRSGSSANNGEGH